MFAITCAVANLVLAQTLSDPTVAWLHPHGPDQLGGSSPAPPTSQEDQGCGLRRLRLSPARPWPSPGSSAAVLGVSATCRDVTVLPVLHLLSGSTELHQWSLWPPVADLRGGDTGQGLRALLPSPQGQFPLHQRWELSPGNVSAWSPSGSCGRSFLPKVGYNSLLSQPRTRLCALCKWSLCAGLNNICPEVHNETLFGKRILQVYLVTFRWGLIDLGWALHPMTSG